MPDTATDEVQYESPVAPITAPIPTPQPPLVQSAPAQGPPPPRVVTMPDRQLFAQQQRDKDEADYLKQVYQQAKNMDQAVKDVSSARRMLGLLKADREIKSGVPVEKAMYNNMQYFTQPGQPSFAPTMKALQPPQPAPLPRTMNVPGLAAPALVDQRGVPHFAPRTSMTPPTPETGPVQSQPVLLPDGTPDPHHVVVRSGNANKIISVKNKDELDDLTPSARRAVLNTAVGVTEKLLSAPGITSDQRKTYSKDLQNYRKELDDMLHPTKAAAPVSTVPSTAKPLNKESASRFLQQAGGDKEKARKLARDAGFTF